MARRVAKRAKLLEFELSLLVKSSFKIQDWFVALKNTPLERFFIEVRKVSN